MSGCDSRKKKRELNKEEIRQCIEVFGDVINKRYDVNRIPTYDHNTLTYIKHPKTRINSRRQWYQIFPTNGPILTENKVINFKPKMVSIVGQEIEE